MHFKNTGNDLNSLIEGLPVINTQSLRNIAVTSVHFNFRACFAEIYLKNTHHDDLHKTKEHRAIVRKTKILLGDNYLRILILLLETMLNLK